MTKHKVTSYRKKKTKFGKKSNKKRRSTRRRSSKKRRSTRRRSTRRRSKKRRSTRQRKFGSKGPGYKGQTSFQNGYVNYFGAPEPFVNASEWFYPNPGSKGGLIGTKKTNYQSPNMIYKY